MRACDPLLTTNHRWSGWSPGLDGFCWCAGQGGYGIQTAPGMDRITTDLVRGDAFLGDFSALRIAARDLAPDRPALKDAVRFKEDAR